MRTLQKTLKTILWTIFTLAVLLGLALGTLSVLGIQLIVRM